MLALRSPDCVCNSCPVEASTRIEVVCPASSSVPLNVVVKEAFTSRPETVMSENPVFLTTREYFPGRSDSMRYEPDESVSVTCAAPPRSELVASTVAFKTTAPELSTITPAITPLLVCAYPGTTDSAANASSVATRITVRHLSCMDFPPELMSSCFSARGSDSGFGDQLPLMTTQQPTTGQSLVQSNRHTSLLPINLHVIEISAIEYWRKPALPFARSDNPEFQTYSSSA